MNSIKFNNRCPPSNIGIGNKLIKPRFREIIIINHKVLCKPLLKNLQIILLFGWTSKFVCTPITSDYFIYTNEVSLVKLYICNKDSLNDSIKFNFLFSIFLYSNYIINNVYLTSKLFLLY